MRRWFVYAVAPDGSAYLWSTNWTRWGATRSATQFTLMPIWLVPMDPIIVNRDELTEFGSTYTIREI